LKTNNVKKKNEREREREREHPKTKNKKQTTEEDDDNKNALREIPACTLKAARKPRSVFVGVMMMP
jgi:hypothetical protein